MLTVISTSGAFADVIVPSPWPLDSIIRLDSRSRFKDGQPDAPSTSGDHLLFASPQIIDTWIRPYLSFLAKMNAEPAPWVLVPRTDPRYPSLEEVVRAVWAGFERVYPEQTRGLGVPPVVLLDSRTANAFVMRDPSNDSRVAHAVVVLSGIMGDSAVVSPAVRAIIAHELAHSVFKHAIASHQGRYIKFFRKDPSGRMGYEAPYEADLNASMIEWAKKAALVGDHSSDHYRNLPTRGLGMNDYPLLYRVWDALHEAMYRDGLECNSALATRNAYRALFWGDLFAQRIRVSPAAVWPAMSDAVVETARICEAGRRHALVSLIAQAFGVEESRVARDATLENWIERYDAAPSAIEGIQAVVSLMRPRMAEIERQIRFQDIEYYGYEEHADEAGMIALAAAGLRPADLGDYFLGVAASRNPEFSARCDREYLSQGRVPDDSGSFSDAHRNDCYRVAHVRQFAGRIESRLNQLAEFAAEHAARSSSSPGVR